jgi:hypothetical protein
MMATWADLKSYINAHYKVAVDAGANLVLEFELGGGRSQAVFIGHDTLNLGLGTEESWVIVESPIGEVDTVDVRKALAEVQQIVCGGLGLSGKYLTVRDAFPLANLDANEFERPLRLITVTADAIEKALSGRDEF